MAKAPNLFARMMTRFRAELPVPARREQQMVEAGQMGRRMAAIPANQVALNELIRRWGAQALARSRYLCLNNPYTTSAKEAFVAALAGFGCKPSSLIENSTQRADLMRIWLDWTNDADADGLSDFYGMQSLAAGELFEAGEVFVVFSEQRQEDAMSGIPVQLRLLPAEMLPQFEDAAARGVVAGNHVRMGIEFDPRGRRVAYHFLRRHPGETFNESAPGIERVRVDARDVVHMFRPIRPGQIRGIPHTLSSLITLAMLDLYDDSELERKRTTSLFAAFITRPAAVDDNGNEIPHPMGSKDSVTGEIGLEPAALIDLQPGEDVKMAEPADVGQQYEAFQYRMLLRAAAGMGVPYYSMTGDPNKANYSALRAGLVEFKRRIVPMQHSVMIFHLCRRTWLRVIDSGTFYGQMPWTRAAYVGARNVFTRAKWIPPHWDYVDPQKDAAAEITLIDNLLKARSDSIEEQGYDPEETDRRIQTEQTRERELGLERHGNAMRAPAPGLEDGEESTEGGEGEEGDREAIENARTAADAYGVAVRGGAVTPQIEDEIHFRTIMRLPEATQLVRDAWLEEGVRRPITLQPPVAETVPGEESTEGGEGTIIPDADSGATEGQETEDA